eukprot:gnl/MRDRNA2_/MRDRNA2_145090_c0_seq1.p1 gnl/MRDRNA2_/MRDRNA2_145090_c0~~gnl/MRDRNA2_/MRDRNA2_145090_c0_seq1.p1  ORF type:complete len:643 (-),score=94.69 gnl/MRDRNA2_/MRDRNA2_145090_c0_seq1:127-2055(-)
MPRRNFLDLTEDPYYLVRATDNVYSYFMFIGPTDSKKEKGVFTWDMAMAYILIVMNFAMQGTLLYTIFNEVVVANYDWQNGIMTVGGNDWGLFDSGQDSETCNDGGSLCFLDASGNFTCAPPTVQLAQRWNELDLNGDGVWTLKEVEEAKDKLKCKYVVNPVEVFTVFQNVLLAHEDKIWLHPDVKAGKAIHKPYFEFAMGDVIMCGYRNQDLCPNLIDAGYFHAPLKYNTSPRVGNTIDSALAYCRNLLDDGGFCELNLPSTYRTWKIESGQQCGSPSYSKFTYTNPGSGVIKSLLSVDYSARQEYELSKTVVFRSFKAVVLFLWLIAMLTDFREITMILTWCIKFPDAEQFGDEAVIEEADPADPEDVRYRIQGIIRSHRLNVAALICIRGVMSVIILYVGTNYLLKQTDYVDLLLNGVALIFIVEIANVLYGQVLREEIRDQCEDIFPMKAAMYGIDYLNRRPALVDIISVGVLLVIVYYVMDWHQQSIVRPVHDALECTCLSSGSTCYEAQKFGFDFWHTYWKDTVPAIFTAVASLKSGGGAVAFSAHGAAHVETDEKHASKQLFSRSASLTVHPEFKEGADTESELESSDIKSLLAHSPRVHPASLPEKHIHHHHKPPHKSQMSSWIHRHFSLSGIG